MQRRAFVATVGLASLAGCTGGNNGGESGQNEGETEQTPEQRLPENAPENVEVATTDDLLKVFLRNVDTYEETRVVADGELQSVQPENDVFVGIRAEVWNVSSEERERVDRNTFALWSGGEVYEELQELTGGYDMSSIRDKRITVGDFDYEPVVGFEELAPDSSQNYWMLFDVPESTGYLMEWEPTEAIDGETESVYIREYSNEG